MLGSQTAFVNGAEKLGQCGGGIQYHLKPLIGDNYS